MFIEGADREPLLMDVKILKEITDYYIHWFTVLFGGENMTFNDIYNQFIKSTKENFPVDACTKQNEIESNVFDSNIPYLCLVIDKRFDNYWSLYLGLFCFWTYFYYSKKTC